MANELKDPTLVRWLAIAGALGATISAGLSHFRQEWIWPAVAVILGFLTVAAITLLLSHLNQRGQRLQLVQRKTETQVREVSALQEELAVHRQLERELSEAKQAAEAAMMAKGEFLATMSHEIRTPLNGILPMLDLLLSSDQPSDQRDITRTAYASAKQMLRIVDDILDYSKLEANKLQLETTSFNLRELLESVLHLMEKSAESKGLRLGLQLDPNVRLAVRGDPVRLRQVLTNLLSNAIKFTERGSVMLSISKKGESRTQHQLRFEVRDSGIGISKEAMGRLFRPFNQADASTTRLYGGTGLGLVICKRIIDLMGGSIHVESEQGRGSTFYFDVPLQKTSGDVQQLRSELSGSKILLLSTDPLLRQRLQQAAPAWGVTLSFADATQDALSRLRAAIARGSNWSFDILLVDLSSVRSTAIALHRNLRRSEELTDIHLAYLQGEEAPPHELGEGKSLLLSRQIGTNELRAALQNHLTSSVVRTTAAEMQAEIMMAPESRPAEAIKPVIETPRAKGPTVRGRLLLVEDNPVNLLVAQRLISLLGAQCDCAEHGEKALELLRSQKYDAVLMDCQMPVKDGYTATHEWRLYEQSNNLPRTPIIAMTANAMAGDRQKCLDVGMDDYLSKPVDRRVLESKLLQWMQKKPFAVVADVERRSGEDATRQLLASAGTVVDFETASAAQRVLDPSQATSRTPTVPATASPPRAPTPLPVRQPLAATPLKSTPDGARSAELAIQNQPPAPPAAVASEAAPSAGPVILDPAVLEELQAVMGDEYLSLVRLFLEDAPKHVHALENAAANNDIAAMVVPAHTLKSSSANLGAMALSASAKRIELAARQNQVPRPVIMVAVLEQEYRRAQLALRKLL